MRPHRTSPQEVAGLLAVIERDLSTSADPDLDSDWRFAIAYNASLQCAAAALKAAGFEVPKGGGAHHHTIGSLRLTLDADPLDVEMLQRFRAKRAGGIYESTGIASNAEVDELRALAARLQSRLLTWLKSEHAWLLDEPGPKKPSFSGKVRRKDRQR